MSHGGNPAVENYLSFPRLRGDEPVTPMELLLTDTFSPPTRG